jgi:hypothetical protein
MDCKEMLTAALPGSITAEAVWDANFAGMLRGEYATAILGHDAARPRSQQTELGVSQVAHPCDLQFAYGTLGAEKCNPGSDRWNAIIGTAVHANQQLVMQWANTELGRERWLTETPVKPAPWLTGNVDLYDRDHGGTVIDWKVTGSARLTKYRKEMSTVYRRQVQLYGLGFSRAGYPVKTVGVCLLPRSGELANSYLWTEPYDAEFATNIVKRREHIIAMLNDFQVETNPERFQWIPRHADEDCRWCPWFSAHPTAPVQCAGAPKPAADIAEDAHSA